MREMASAISHAAAADGLCAEHFIHLRCEVSAPDVPPSFEAMVANDRGRLASLMDHAPGQRQFVDLETYRTYDQGKTGMMDGCVLDVLSSDDAPFSLIQATFALGGRIGLAAAARMVTQTPAEVAGLIDSCAVEPGLRADLVRVRAPAASGRPPFVRGVWREGRRVA